MNNLDRADSSGNEITAANHRSYRSRRLYRYIRENLSENEGVDDGIFFVAVRRDPLSVKPRGWPAANAELCL